MSLVQASKSNRKWLKKSKQQMVLEQRMYVFCGLWVKTKCFLFKKSTMAHEPLSSFLTCQRGHNISSIFSFAASEMEDDYWYW